MSRVEIVLELEGYLIEVDVPNQWGSMRQRLDEAFRRAVAQLDAINPPAVPDKKNLGFIPGQGEVNADRPI